jgi:benzoate/toluate 1,2-dioxygenase beta subunit
MSGAFANGWGFLPMTAPTGCRRCRTRKARSTTRIERLEHPRIHVQTPPSRTAHLVGNALIEAADEGKGECVVGSTVIMVEYRDDQQRIFAGRQHHRLRREGDTLRIVQKRVDLINCDSAFEAIAVPI